ncbi:MAG: CHAT domain-containing protein [Leptolyngbyaceae cyanobacterium bins.349]|nr:CHAT domain-containing protein [Leptolyngbyaceae cyanobacterium bins.349]
MHTVMTTLMTKAQAYYHKTRQRWRLALLIALFAIALFLALRFPALAQLPPSSSSSSIGNSAATVNSAATGNSAAAATADPRQLYNQGRFEEARQQWEQAANVAAAQGDRVTELANRINQAQALKGLGAYLRAERVLTTALAQIDTIQPNQQSEKTTVLELKAKLLRSLGEVYQAIGQADQAYQALICSLDTAKTLNNSSEISNAYFSLGMAERAEILRNAARTFVLNSQADLQPKLKLVTAFMAGELRPDQPCAESPQQRPVANLPQVLAYFQQATLAPGDASPNATLAIKAELNQFSLLMDVLPRLNQFLTEALAFSRENITTLSRAYFLTDYLKNSSLLTSLKPDQVKTLFQVIRALPGEGAPAQPIVDLARLQIITVDFMNGRVPELLNQIQANLRTLPTAGETEKTVETVNIRINYAQSLLRLQQVVSQSNEVDQQLQKILGNILQEVEQVYKTTPQTLKLPPVKRIRPILKTLTAKQVPLFLPPASRNMLQQVADQSVQTAIAILPPAIAQARQVNNQRAEAAAQIAFAEIIAQGAAQTNDANAWAVVESRSLAALKLVQTQDAPDLVFRAQRQYAQALSQQANVSAARAACRVAATTLQANRSNLVTVDQDVQYTFRDSVEPFYRDCAEALLPLDGETLPPEQLQANLEDARNLIDSLQLAELDNFFRDACLEGKKVKLDTLIDAQSPTTAVIYPILTTTKNAAGTVSKNRLGVIVKIPNQKDLEYRAFREDFNIDLFLTNLRTRLITGKTNNTVNQDLQTVYQWLIQPFEEKFAGSGVKTLVFVLDSTFRGIPMAALYDGKQYLVESPYAIAVTPGLQLIDSKQPPKTQLNVLAAGVSDFTNAPSRKLSGILFAPLQPVQDEINLLGSRRATPAASDTAIKLLGDKGFARILPDQKFTITNLTQELQATSFNIVHLATHGVFSSRKEETFIAAYDQLIFVDQFSNIFQRQRQRQDAPIDLLILSACQTATGDNRAVLGLSGIALKAGVRSTLSTLWTADAPATVAFMNKFYEAIQTNSSKADAVKIAQQELLKDPQYRNQPSIWAAYVLVGNWS